MPRSIDASASRLLAIKLAMVILLVATIGVSLLSYRQQRLASAHELAIHHARALADERVVLRLRLEIADRISLPKIQSAMIARRADEPAADQHAGRVPDASTHPQSLAQPGLVE